MTTGAAPTETPDPTTPASTTTPRVSIAPTTARTATTFKAQTTKVVGPVDVARTNTTRLYGEENDLRIGLGIGLAAFICVIIFIVACLINRRQGHPSTPQA